jgi:hypothetical protein
MKIAELIQIANEAYPDSKIEENFNPKTGKATRNTHGDGLANFIVRELCDTFSPKASQLDQLTEASRVMSMACGELESVKRAFTRQEIKEVLVIGQNKTKRRSHND